MSNADTLVTKISGERTVPDGVAVLIDGILASFEAAGNDPASLVSVREDFRAKAKSLVAAVIVGTTTHLSSAAVVTQQAANDAAALAVERCVSARPYAGKVAYVVREARPTDQGYDTKAGPQTLIKLEDGSQKVVPDTEITPKAPPSPDPRSPRQYPGSDARGNARTYQGGPVTLVRMVQSGDSDYVAGVPARAVIRLADGSQKTVAASDLS